MRTSLLALLVLCGCTGGGTLEPETPTPALETACGDSVPPSPERVLTGSGVVEGVRDGEVLRFLGVPFAEPPVGALRFAAPQPYACREELFVADRFAPVCLQPDLESGGVVGDEDCLALNVFAPASALRDGRPRPVLFFVHGGGQVVGSTSEGDGFFLYDGGSLVAQRDVIVVTAAYRLGALGFLAHPALAAADDAVSGNLGLQDQQLGLRWVQENIAAFGGDPTRVLLFGESAGGLNTCAHLVSPSSVGLFSAALMQSGGCAAQPKQEAEDAGVVAVDSLGCSVDPLPCLRAISGAALAELSGDPLSGGLAGGGGFGLSVDDDRLPATPMEIIEAGEHNRVPFILGANAQETSRSVPLGAPTAAQYPQVLAATFGALADAVEAVYPLSDFDSAHEAWVTLTTEVQFICPSRRIARAVRASQSEPVRRYFFTQRPEGPAGELYGSWHGLELVYVFAQLEAVSEATGYQPSARDEAVQDAMSTAWAQLAAGEEPAGWPEFDEDEQMMEFGGSLLPIDDVRVARCDFWDEIFDQFAR